MAQRDPTKSKLRKQALRDAPTVRESARTGQGSFGFLGPKVEPARTAGLLAPSVPLAAPVSSTNRVSTGAAAGNSRAATVSEAQNAPASSRSNQTKPDIRDIELKDLESFLKIVPRIQSGEPVRLSPQAVRSLTDDELERLATRLTNFIGTERGAVDALLRRKDLDDAQLKGLAKEEKKLRDDLIANAGANAVGFPDPSIKSLKALRKLIPPALLFGLSLSEENAKAEAKFNEGMLTRGKIDVQSEQAQEIQRAIRRLSSQLDAVRAEQKRRKSLTDEMRPLPPGS